MPWKGTGRRRRPDTGRSTCSPVDNGPPRAHNTAAPLVAQQQPQQPRTSTPTNTTHAQPPAKSPAQRIHAPRRRARHQRVRPSNTRASTRPPSTRQPRDGLASCKEALGAACVKSRMQTHTLSCWGRGGATGRIARCSPNAIRGAANPLLRALLLPHTARVQAGPCGLRECRRRWRASVEARPNQAGPPTLSHESHLYATRARPPPPPLPRPRLDAPTAPGQIGTMPPSHVMWSQHGAVPNSRMDWSPRQP